MLQTESNDKNRTNLFYQFIRKEVQEMYQLYQRCNSWSTITFFLDEHMKA